MIASFLDFDIRDIIKIDTMLCARARARARVCVCVCVCVWERERERSCIHFCRLDFTLINSRRNSCCNFAIAHILISQLPA